MSPYLIPSVRPFMLLCEVYLFRIHRLVVQARLRREAQDDPGNIMRGPRARPRIANGDEWGLLDSAHTRMWAELDRLLKAVDPATRVHAMTLRDELRCTSASGLSDELEGRLIGAAVRIGEAVGLSLAAQRTGDDEAYSDYAAWATLVRGVLAELVSDAATTLGERHEVAQAIWPRRMEEATETLHTRALAHVKRIGESANAGPKLDRAEAALAAMQDPFRKDSADSDRLLAASRKLAKAVKGVAGCVERVRKKTAQLARSERPDGVAGRSEHRSAAAGGKKTRDGPPPLTETEQAVLDLIREKSPKGILGKHICEQLSKRKPAIQIIQSTLTSHMIPPLKAHYGIKNRRGVGYYDPNTT